MASVKSNFVPDDFVLTDDQKHWALVKAPWLDIDDQEERWRDHEYKVPHSCWNRAWRNWIRKAIEIYPRPASHRETQLDLPAFAGREKGMSNVVKLKQVLNGKR